MQSTEEWRPVVGYEGQYEVSNLGVVRRTRATKRYPAGSRLREYQLPQGHLRVQLGGKGGARLVLVHRLVAFAFIGQPAPGEEICHADGDPTNNDLSNIRWGTRSDNMQDRLKHGRHPLASATSCPNGHEYTPENTARRHSQALP